MSEKPDLAINKILGVKHVIEVCQGPSCGPLGSPELFDMLKEMADDNADVAIVKTGCLGHCDFSPNMKINGEVKTTIKEEDLTSIYESLV